MKLKITVEGESFPIEVPESILTSADEFFRQLDADMDRGWQMSRDWVEAPDQYQRCQIVADKIVSAIHRQNQKMGVLLAAYILKRVPGIQEVLVDTSGEMSETELVV
ncbi:MAG: hypothetical protein Q9O24_10475 [Gammaproteobacteria bacterium]|nr:hypothetical protein [Gammaproteobacteria bacterium]